MMGSNHPGNKFSGYNRNNSGYNNARNAHGYNPNNNSSGYGERMPGSRKQLYCDHCKITGHTVQKCYKLYGYPPGHRLFKGKKVAASAMQESEENSWLEGINNSSVPIHVNNQPAPAVSLPTLSSE